MNSGYSKMISKQNVTQDWNLNKGCKVWKLRKTNKNKTKEKKKNKRNTHTKQNKTRNKREKEWEKKVYLPNPPHFSECFFKFSLPVSSSKSLEHNPFALLKLC